MESVKIISIGSHTEQIPSIEPNKTIHINRTYREHDDKKYYGLGFINFGPATTVSFDRIYNFNLKQTKKGVGYVSLFRFDPWSKFPGYYLISVATN